MSYLQELVRELYDKENELEQVVSAVRDMGDAKDMVALNLAHKCDELQVELGLLEREVGLVRASEEEPNSVLALRRELRTERAQRAAKTDEANALRLQLDQTQAQLAERDRELRAAQGLVDHLEARLKVAGDMHEHVTCDLHRQIDALSAVNTPMGQLSMAVSPRAAEEASSSDPWHLEIEDEGILLPLRDSIRAAAAAVVASAGTSGAAPSRRGLTNTSTAWNKENGRRHGGRDGARAEPRVPTKHPSGHSPACASMAIAAQAQPHQPRPSRQAARSPNSDLAIDMEKVSSRTDRVLNACASPGPTPSGPILVGQGSESK